MLLGCTLFALAAPAAIVGALWLASRSSGDPPARLFAVLATDPATLSLRESLVSWGVTVSAVGTWLVGVGLILEGRGKATDEIAT